jgi:hypothetical protein
MESLLPLVVYGNTDNLNQNCGTVFLLKFTFKPLFWFKYDVFINLMVIDNQTVPKRDAYIKIVMTRLQF